MSKKINQSNQSNGSIQTSLIESNNNNLTIINNPLEHVRNLINDNKTEELQELFSNLYNEVAKTHPLYPNYSYVPIKIGTQVLYKHEAVNKITKNALPLKIMGTFRVNEPDFKENETISEFIFRKSYKEEKINITINSKTLETWIGDTKIDNTHTIEKYIVENGKSYILPQELPPPIKVKMVQTEYQNNAIFDYLELGVSEVNKAENRISISNEKQNKSPIIINLNINFFKNDKQNSNFTESTNMDIHFNIRDSFKGTIIAEILSVHISKMMAKSSKVTFINIETQETIAEGVVNNIDLIEYQNEDEYLKVLKDLLKIESRFDISFTLPEKISNEDLENIRILQSILRDEERTLNHLLEWSVSHVYQENSNEMIEIMRKNDIGVTFVEDIKFELFGVNFKNITGNYSIENIKLKDAERMKVKLEHMDEGDTIKLIFLPTKITRVAVRYTYCDEIYRNN